MRLTRPFVTASITGANYYPNANIYRKRGKIHWAKQLQFQPYEVFHGNTFTVPWPALFTI